MVGAEISLRVINTYLLHARLRSSHRGRDDTLSDGQVEIIHSLLLSFVMDLVPPLAVQFARDGVAVHVHEGGIVGLVVHGAGGATHPES